MNGEMKKMGRPVGRRMLENPVLINFQVNAEVKGKLEEIANEGGRVNGNLSQLLRDMCDFVTTEPDSFFEWVHRAKS